MKKTMLHRFGALALAAMLAMSLAVTPAMAAEGDGGGETPPAVTNPAKPEPRELTHKLADGGTHALKIKNVNAGATYKFYKLLDLDVTTETTDVEDENGKLTSDTNVVSYWYKIPSGENTPAIKSTVERVLRQDQFMYGAMYNDKQNTMGFYVDGFHVVFQKPALTQIPAETEAEFEARKEAMTKNPDESDAEFEARKNALTKREAETDAQFAARKEQQPKDEAKLMLDFADALRAAIITSESDEDLSNDLTPQFEAATKDINNGDVINGDSIKFTGLDDGYWMVTTNAGVRSIVFTNPSEKNGDMEIDNKNPAPKLTKDVWDSDDIWAETGSEKVNYEICTDKACGNYNKDPNQDTHIWVYTTGANAGEKLEEGVKRDPTTAAPVHIGKYEPDNDIGVNGEAAFRINVDVYSGARNLMVVDTLDKGLRFDGELDSVIFYPRRNATELGREVEIDEAGTTSTKIDLYRKDSDEAKTAGRFEYELTYNTDNTTGKTTIKIQFSRDFLDPQTDTHPMDKVFKGDLSDINDDGGKIEILYRAKLTGADLTKEELVFKNSALLKYSGDPKFDNDPDSWIETGKTETNTYTYELDLRKHVKGNENAFLPGAKFVLYRAIFNSTSKNYLNGNIEIDPTDKAVIDNFDEWVKASDKGTATDAKLMKEVNGEMRDVMPDNWWDGHGVMYFTLEHEGNAKEATVYVPVVYDEGKTTDEERAGWIRELVTPASGKIVIKGLDAGLYAFGETEAPKDYNKLEAPVMAVIGNTVIKGVDENGEKTEDKNGSVFVSDKNNNANGLKFVPLKSGEGVNAIDSIEVMIANASGLQMPSTGGIGTTIFYAVGGILVLGAGILLIIKKRAGSDE